MVNSQKKEDYEQVVEKIVFDEEELQELKIIIRNFTEGKIQPKQLKQKLLLCRGRIVKDISNFLSFCIDRVQDTNRTLDIKKTNLNQFENEIEPLRQQIAERNELLEVVAEKINVLEEKAQLFK